MAPAPSKQAFYDRDVLAMPTREPAMRTATAQYVTLESTKERPHTREVVYAPPPKQKKRAVLLPSVTDVAIDESEANGPWDDVEQMGDMAKVGGRFKEGQMMSALSKKVQRKEWRKRQKKKYGTVRKYGERADIRKKSRPVTRKIKKLVRGK